MTICSTIEYKDKIWGYVWFNSAPGLEEEIIDDIMFNMVEMYHDGDDIRTVKKNNYDALIFKRKSQSLGMFVGTHFDSEFETEKLKSKLSILLIDSIDPMSN